MKNILEINNNTTLLWENNQLFETLKTEKNEIWNIEEVKIMMMKLGINLWNNTFISKGRITSCNGLFVKFGWKWKDGVAKVSFNTTSPLFLEENNGEYTLTIQWNNFGLDYISPCLPNVQSKIFIPQFSWIRWVSLFGCQLVNEEQQCKFCASKPFDGPSYTLEEFMKEFEMINSQVSVPIQKVTVNAGSVISLPQRWYELMQPYIQYLQQKSVKEINLEIMPPYLDQDATIQMLLQMKSDWITSCQFNMEVWNWENRKKIMPYKGKIPIDTYLRIISLGSEVFGIGKVSSVVLAWLNSLENLQEASDQIMDNGWIPSIEIFRSLPNTLMENTVTTIDYKEINKLNTYIQSTLKKKYWDMIFDTFEGCLECSGCNILKPL